MRLECPSIADIKFRDDDFVEVYLIIYGTVDVMFRMRSTGDAEPLAGGTTKDCTKLTLLLPLLGILTVTASFTGLTC